MRYLGFDGREHPINTTDYIIYLDDSQRKSQYHIRARQLLSQLFPFDLILEEVTLPGSRGAGKILYADFLIPGQKILVEVHGEQHYSFNSFFYKNKTDFILAQKRDKDKKRWCEINNLSYVELNYKENDDQWKDRIRERNIC